jgi:hypothetical protein
VDLNHHPQLLQLHKSLQTKHQILELQVLQPQLVLQLVKSLTLVLDQDLAQVLLLTKEVVHLVLQVPVQLLLKIKTYQPQLPVLLQHLRLSVDPMVSL